jgi:hypothetical protein
MWRNSDLEEDIFDEDEGLSNKDLDVGINDNKFIE